VLDDALLTFTCAATTVEAASTSPLVRFDAAVPASVVLKLPLSRFLLLYWVLVAMRSISEVSEVSSDAMAPRSVLVRVSFDPWTESSRMRCRIEVVSFRPPSAVWIIEMPSCALRAAWFRPRTCEVSLSLMARPAASSAAELIR